MFTLLKWNGIGHFYNPCENEVFETSIINAIIMHYNNFFELDHLNNCDYNTFKNKYFDKIIKNVSVSNIHTILDPFSVIKRAMWHNYTFDNIFNKSGHFNDIDNAVNALYNIHKNKNQIIVNPFKKITSLNYNEIDYSHIGFGKIIYSERSSRFIENGDIMTYLVTNYDLSIVLDNNIYGWGEKYKIYSNENKLYLHNIDITITNVNKIYLAGDLPSYGKINIEGKNVTIGKYLVFPRQSNYGMGLRVI